MERGGRPAMALRAQTQDRRREMGPDPPNHTADGIVRRGGPGWCMLPAQGLLTLFQSMLGGYDFSVFQEDDDGNKFPLQLYLFGSIMLVSLTHTP